VARRFARDLGRPTVGQPWRRLRAKPSQDLLVARDTDQGNWALPETGPRSAIPAAQPAPASPGAPHARHQHTRSRRGRVRQRLDVPFVVASCHHVRYGWKRGKTRFRPPVMSERTSSDQWVAVHADTLYRYAVSRVGDPSVAEDLVQDSLLAALEGRRSFRGGANLADRHPAPQGGRPLPGRREAAGDALAAVRGRRFSRRRAVRRKRSLAEPAADMGAGRRPVAGAPRVLAGVPRLPSWPPRPAAGGIHPARRRSEECRRGLRDPGHDRDQSLGCSAPRPDRSPAVPRRSLVHGHAATPRWGYRRKCSTVGKPVAAPRKRWSARSPAGSGSACASTC